MRLQRRKYVLGAFSPYDPVGLTSGGAAGTESDGKCDANDQHPSPSKPSIGYTDRHGYQ